MPNFSNICRDEDEADDYPDPTPPALYHKADFEQNVARMVRWFCENYAKPDETEYDPRTGEYDFTWGGPFDAGSVFAEAFPQLIAGEVKAAQEIVERDGTTEWTIHSSRTPTPSPSPPT